MTLSTFSLLLAALGTALTLGLFALIGYLYGDRAHIFFANRSLKSPQIRANAAATSTSLAGALLFFFTTTPAFGWIILLVPIFSALGIYLFIELAKPFEPSPTETGSILRLLHWHTDSPYISRAANLVVLVNIAFIFVIEVVIGAQIFDYFAPQYPFSKIVAILLMCSVITFYVIIGGFAAVSHSDLWQLGLVMIALFLTFLTLGILFVDSNHTAGELLSVFENPKFPVEFQVSFLVNLVFVNVALPITQVSTWQRYSSAVSQQEAFQGLKTAIKWRMLPIWFGAITCSALYYVIKGDAPTFPLLFDMLRTSGAWGALIVFPVLFVGLVAALISTADSLMIAVMLAADDARRKLTDRQEQPEQKFEWEISAHSGLSVEYLSRVAIVLVLVAIAIQLLLQLSPAVERTIVQLLFAGYGLSLVILPVIVFSCLWPKIALNDRPVVYGMWVGFFILGASAIYGIWTGNYLGTHLGPVAGAFAAAVGVHLGVRGAA